MDGPVEIELEPTSGRPRRSPRPRQPEISTPEKSTSDEQTAFSFRGSVVVAAVALAAVLLLVIGFVAGRTSVDESGPAADEAIDDDGVADDDDDDAPDTAADAAADETSDESSESGAVGDDPVLETLPSPGGELSGDRPAPGDLARGDGQRGVEQGGVGTGDEPGEEPDAEPAGIRTIDVGAPLLPGPTGVVVVAISDDRQLVEIDLDAGVVRITPVDLRRLVEPSVVALPDVTVVAPAFGATGSLLTVPVGETEAGELSSVLMSGGSPIPGPGRNELWSLVRDGPFPEPRVYQRLDVTTGELVGDTLEIDAFSGVAPDSRGGLLLVTPSGAYRADEAGFTRIGVGRLIATGANHDLVEVCDDAFVCEVELVDVASGERTKVETSVSVAASAYATGSLAPDGTAYVAFEPWRSSVDAVYVLHEMIAGETHELSTGNSGSGRYGWPEPHAAVAWTDDSRFVLHLDDGRLTVFDRQSATIRQVGRDTSGHLLDVPDLIAFDTRPTR